MPLKLAILGRPNVGKSTLFNRLIGKRKAIVLDLPGVTRDRKEEPVSIGGLNFTLVDTAGLESKGKDTITQQMTKQSLFAAENADIICFMYDARAGITPIDEEFARKIKKFNKPTLLLANKAENPNKVEDEYLALKLGFREPIMISAEHGIGTGDLYEALMDIIPSLNMEIDDNGNVWRQGEIDKLNKNIEKNLSKLSHIHSNIDIEDMSDDELEEEEDFRDIKVAIIGRPNAGKSTLFNSIIGEERAITSNISGTTRDSIYHKIDFEGKVIELIDTAGIRKKHHKGDTIEELSVDDSMESLNFANVIILMIDGEVGLDRIELRLADKIVKEGRACVIAINKWDILSKEQREFVHETLKDKLNYSLTNLRSSQYINISAIKGKNTHKLLAACVDAYKGWNKKIPTSKLNDWLRTATDYNIPPICGGKRVKFKFIKQSKARPPEFKIFTSSNLVNFPESYKRYLKNDLRNCFDIEGTPIRIKFVKSSNPFE